LRFRLKTDVGGTDTLIGAPVSTGVWTHVAFTYDGATMKIYKDGFEAASRAKTGNLVTNPLVGAWIGANPTNNKWFDGVIDEVQIFTRALTESEVQQEMTEPVGAGVPGDLEVPTVPAVLTPTPLSSSRIQLDWNASTDNFVVTGYRIYRDGVAVGTRATTSYTDVGLTPETLYSYTVSARDAAGNESPQSTPPA